MNDFNTKSRVFKINPISRYPAGLQCLSRIRFAYSLLLLPLEPIKRLIRQRYADFRAKLLFSLFNIINLAKQVTYNYASPTADVHCAVYNITIINMHLIHMLQ